MALRAGTGAGARATTRASGRCARGRAVGVLRRAREGRKPGASSAGETFYTLQAGLWRGECGGNTLHLHPWCTNIDVSHGGGILSPEPQSQRVHRAPLGHCTELRGIGRGDPGRRGLPCGADLGVARPGALSTDAGPWRAGELSADLERGGAGARRSGCCLAGAGAGRGAHPRFGKRLPRRAGAVSAGRTPAMGRADRAGRSFVRRNAASPGLRGAHPRACRSGNGITEDPRLTGLGEMQVHRLGEYLIAGEESFAAIVASPL
jgi:hypothetical protein